MIAEQVETSVDLAVLVENHQKGIWRYLRALGCDAALADDLTQETFLTVVKKPFEYRGEAAAAAYLRQVARSRFISAMRKQGREPVKHQLDLVEAHWQTLMPDNQGDEVMIALQSCLRKLPKEAKTAIRMRYEEKRSRKESADALSMSEDGVKSLLRRARRALRGCIEKKLGEGGYGL